jgi:cytochrome P450
MRERVNLLDPNVLAHPYPHYAQMRRDSPVCQVDPGGMWAVTRYDDILTVLKNPQLFSSEGLMRSMEPPWVGRNPLARSILVMDPPRHGRLRALVSRAFGPHIIARLEPLLRSTAERLVNAMLEAREVDFMLALASPLPAAAIGRLLGLEHEIDTTFKRWSDDLALLSAVPEGDLERQAQIRGSIQEMERSMQKALERSRREPGADLISDLIAARVDGEALTEAELISFLFLLLAAGLETTTNLLGNAALMLTDHPEIQERLRSHPELIPAFVDEMLRYDPAAISTFRLTTAEVELGGVKLPPNTVLILLLASGCHDEACAVDAERFVLDRGEQVNLPFGHGIHFCIGASLARLEARVGLEVLLSRTSSMSRKAEPLVWRPSLQIRGLTRLPVEVLPIA